MERSAGPDMGIAGSYSPDGKKLAINRKGTDVLAQVLSRLLSDRCHGDGFGDEEVHRSDHLQRNGFVADVGTRWFHLLS
jgi:hypothetical protein